MGPAQVFTRPRWAGARLGLEMGLKAGLLSSLTLLKEKKKKTEITKEKKEGLGKEVGHADNLYGLVKMCTVHEN